MQRNLFFIIVIIFSGSSFALNSAQAQTLCTKNKRAIELYTDADNYRVHGRLDEAGERDAHGDFWTTERGQLYPFDDLNYDWRSRF